MEIFLFLLYFLTIYALFQSIQDDDTEFDDKDSGEFNLMDSV